MYQNSQSALKLQSAQLNTKQIDKTISEANKKLALVYNPPPLLSLNLVFRYEIRRGNLQFDASITHDAITAAAATAAGWLLLAVALAAAVK